MTEYEIYSYEAFRRKYEDEIRIGNAPKPMTSTKTPYCGMNSRSKVSAHILRGWTNHTFWNSPAFCGTESRH